MGGSGPGGPRLGPMGPAHGPGPWAWPWLVFNMVQGPLLIGIGARPLIQDRCAWPRPEVKNVGSVIGDRDLWTTEQNGNRHICNVNSFRDVHRDADIACRCRHRARYVSVPSLAWHCLALLTYQSFGSDVLLEILARLG